MVAESWTEPAITFETNLISKIKLYDFLKEKKFLKKYIKISTPEIFGSALIKNSKYNLYNPSTPYALSHSSIEIYLKLLNKQFAFPFIISRFANFYGPYQKLYRLIPLAIHMAKKKKNFKCMAAANLEGLLYILITFALRYIKRSCMEKLETLIIFLQKNIFRLERL